ELKARVRWWRLNLPRDTYISQPRIMVGRNRSEIAGRTFGKPGIVNGSWTLSVTTHAARLTLGLTRKTSQGRTTRVPLVITMISIVDMVRALKVPPGELSSWGSNSIAAFSGDSRRGSNQREEVCRRRRIASTAVPPCARAKKTRTLPRREAGGEG